MRRIPFFAGLTCIVAVALLTGCDDSPPVVSPAPPSSLPTASPILPNGGTCGDGVILRPGEQCP